MRPLHLAHPDGGLVPSTVVVVQRRYPLVFHQRAAAEGGRATYLTRRALERGAGDAERRAARDRELALARQWRAARAATTAQRRYAAALLAGGGTQGDGGGGGLEGGCGGADGGADGDAELRALVEERRAHMEREVQEAVQRALAGGGGGGGGDGADGDAEPPAPVLRLRVSGAAPAALAGGAAAAAAAADAVVRLWRVGDDGDGLREGDVVRVTGLRASRAADFGFGRVLQLDSTKMTHWELVGRADAAAAAGWALRYEPRRALALRELAAAGDLGRLRDACRGEFDFTGLLLWAAAPQGAADGRGGLSQWLFLADETAPGIGGGGPSNGGADPDAPGGGGEQAQQAQQQAPCVLAVQLAGPAGSVDFVEPSDAASLLPHADAAPAAAPALRPSGGAGAAAAARRASGAGLGAASAAAATTGAGMALAAIRVLRLRNLVLSGTCWSAAAGAAERVAPTGGADADAGPRLVNAAGGETAGVEQLNAARARAHSPALVDWARARSGELRRLQEQLQRLVAG